MLFVTLRRGLAGKKEGYLATLKSLGLRKPRQVVEVQNNAASRGQIEKVRVSVRAPSLVVCFFFFFFF